MTRVLIIDDEPYVRDAMRRVLEQTGVTVEVAADAQAGLEAMRRERADVVVTDVIMPRTSGVDAIAAIRREFPDTRIIAMSGGGNFGLTEYQPAAITTSAYLAASRRAGADGVIAKPFATKELLDMLQQVLSASRP